MAGEDTEAVRPAQITEGDTIQDEQKTRWLVVHDIQTFGGQSHAVGVEKSGESRDPLVFHFYGRGPDDKAIFEENQLVNRKLR